MIVTTAVITFLPILNLALFAIIETAHENGIDLPGSVFWVLNSALVITTAIVALLRKLISIPGLVQWLDKYWNVPTEEIRDGLTKTNKKSISKTISHQKGK